MQLGTHKDRKLLDASLFRGDDLINQVDDPAQVLRIFSDMLPNARNLPRAMIRLFGNAARLKAMKRLRGGGAVVSTA